MNTTVFLCHNSLDGIFSGIYEAWGSRLGHSHVRLEFADCYTPELFCDYRSVPVNEEHSRKVARSIRDKISLRAWEWVYRAALSAEPSRADDIYRFLIGGFYFGSKVTAMLTQAPVQRIQELNRMVGNESHYYREFLRFEALKDGVLLAKIRPKADVLTLLTPHFADRIPDESFIIWDVSRNVASIHPSQKENASSTPDPRNWFLHPLTEEEVSLLQAAETDPYVDLWKTFYRTIAIKERINPALQRNRMPVRYREFCPEFQ